jgi:hypothetical protein
MILHLCLVVLAASLLLVTLPLTLELFLLSLAAALPARRHRACPPRAYRLAVVIPAHNEEKLIGTCVRSLLADANPMVEVFAIAHNCTDATAEVARQAGARVLPLNGTRGKGFALDHAFDHVLALGADGVLVIDADSIVSRGTLATIIETLRGGAGALQIRYQASNADANRRTRLAALALLGMNVVRPRGRSRLGLSSGIFGNGFALSAATLARVPYTANSLVEDLEYHLRLIQAGIPVAFLDQATVFGELPEHTAASQTQKTRWEGGRARMRREWTGPLALSVLKGRWRLLEPLLDLLAQPLATQAALLVCLLLLPLPFARLYAAFGIAAAVLYVGVAAGLSGEPAAYLKALATAPAYMLWKLLLIPGKWRARRQGADWVRTERNVEAERIH